MSAAAIQPRYRQDLVTVSCCSCGMEFAVPSSWDERRRENHEGFYCPNGHSLAYNGPTAEKKRIAELESSLEREKREREWAESRIKSANIRRGKAEAALKRAHKRAHAGVCPHCNRTFSQLARHMQSKHSEVLEHS